MLWIVLILVYYVMCVYNNVLFFDFNEVHIGHNVSYLSSTVIDQLHRPASLVLDPDKDPSICITGGQFLEGFIPAHQHHLKRHKTKVNRVEIIHKSEFCILKATPVSVHVSVTCQTQTFSVR